MMTTISVSKQAVGFILSCLIAFITPKSTFPRTKDAALTRTKDANDFPSPKSRCMSTQKGRIITSVGTFPALDHQDLEVVADTRLKVRAGSLTEYENPSINVFNKGCELIWRQSYPSLAEVGFKSINFPGRMMLHISAISVFQPADQVISEEELLSSSGDSLLCELSFGSDLYDASYVGPIGADNEFGVVLKHNSAPMKVSMDAISPAITILVYHWRSFVNPDNPVGSPGYLFVGPEQLEGGASNIPKMSAVPTHPPFPLSTFVFGADYPG